jgi:hypothetical protein
MSFVVTPEHEELANPRSGFLGGESQPSGVRQLSESEADSMMPFGETEWISRNQSFHNSKQRAPGSNAQSRCSEAMSFMILRPRLLKQPTAVNRGASERAASLLRAASVSLRRCAGAGPSLSVGSSYRGIEGQKGSAQQGQKTRDRHRQ